MIGKRSSGILLHPSSLPGPLPIGTLGSGARCFIDFLSTTGQSWWQILPLGPVAYGNSPYQCYSAFAGNPLLIDLMDLVAQGWLTKEDLPKNRFSEEKVDYKRSAEIQLPLLFKTFDGFARKGNPEEIAEYRHFLMENNWWLDDYALFMACRKHLGETSWNTWEPGLANRNADTISVYRRRYNEDYERNRFIQFLFFRQWLQLRKYANKKGIRIIGDLPLYVSYESSDVWGNQNIFYLDKDHKPTKVGGVPPDYFSSTGQLWGNPVYDWESLASRDYDWWIARLHFNLKLFDRIRIDHFRGLESFWAIPAGSKDAVGGTWLKAKGKEMLSLFKSQVKDMSILAEDLGLITPAVEALRNEFHLPGMKVLQFAFSSDSANEYLPQNYEHGFVAYTGTHDNNTTEGWFNGLNQEEQNLVLSYLTGTDALISHRMIRTVWASVASVAIAPLQDILGLDEKARMNTPGTLGNNWEWRFKKEALKEESGRFLLEVTKKYNRLKKDK